MNIPHTHTMESRYSSLVVLTHSSISLPPPPPPSFFSITNFPSSKEEVEEASLHPLLPTPEKSHISQNPIQLQGFWMERKKREGKLKSKEWMKDDGDDDDGSSDGEGDGEVAIGLFLGEEKKKRRGGGGSMKGCQANKCGDDLREARPYHRRHKVCEHHAKASAVLVAGIRQRFCQQCSRFMIIGLVLVYPAA